MAAKPEKIGLENLIPLAVVIACGCEPCAEWTVRRALNAGSSRHHIEETLAIIRYLQTADCLLARVGPDVLARMSKPLAAAARALEHFRPGQVIERQKCG